MTSFSHLPLHLFPSSVAEIGQVRPIKSGMINQTWALGDPPRYVGQIVHSSINVDAEAIIVELGPILREVGIAVPRLVPTIDGSLSVPMPNARRFRVLTWMPGTTRRRPQGKSQVGRMAAVAGRFHAALSLIAQHPLIKRSSLHDTDRYMVGVSHLTAESDLVPELRSLADRILERWVAWKKQHHRTGAPLMVGHGDLRTENFRVDSCTGEVLGLLDFDTIGTYELEEEFCDALRSWCGCRPRQDRTAGFSLARFELALDAYLAETADLFRHEMARLVVGLERIYLELAARYCLSAVHLTAFRIRARNMAERLSRCAALTKFQLDQADHVHAQRAALERIMSRKLNDSNAFR